MIIDTIVRKQAAVQFVVGQRSTSMAHYDLSDDGRMLVTRRDLVALVTDIASLTRFDGRRQRDGVA